MHLCGDKKRGAVSFLPFLKWEKLVLNFNKFSSYLLLATLSMTVQTISTMARLISLVSERKNLPFMENMNTIIRSCVKSVPPFLVFLLQRKTSQNFLQFTREKFPDMTIIPKLHVLEEHVCPFLQQWHMELGLYGEQGIEGIHSAFNTQSPHFDQVKKK